MNLPIEELTGESFAPFGTVIEQPEQSQDAEGPGWRWWAETGLLPAAERPYAIGFLDLKPAPLQFDWAERHLHASELLLPLGGECLVYVGPPDYLDEPGRMPELERFRVFGVKQGQGVLLEPGVWHGAPLANGLPLNVAVLLLQGTGELDTCLVRFEDRPVFIG